MSTNSVRLKWKSKVKRTAPRKPNGESGNTVKVVVDREAVAAAFAANSDANRNCRYAIPKEALRSEKIKARQGGTY